MARLRKRKTKTGYQYVLDFRHKGKRHVLSLRTADKKLAESVRSEIEAKIVLGKFDMEDIGKEDILLSRFLQMYFSSVQGTKMDSTLAGEKIYASTFMRIVGDQPLKDITNAALDRWKHQRLEKVRPVTFNDERRVLSHIFNKALELEYIRKNPFKLIKKLKEQQKRLYLTSEELGKFLAEVEHLCTTARNATHRSNYRKFKLFCEVLLNTGMRRSELLSLQIGNVDFETGVIRVEKAKGKKRREIPMSGRVKVILEGLSPQLFADMTANQVTHMFTRCAKWAGLEGLKLHSLRHTFGTYLIAMGYDITVVKELLGHEDINTTLIYAKANNRLLRDAVRSFENFGRNGYKMVTRETIVEPTLLEEKETSVSDDGT